MPTTAGWRFLDAATSQRQRSPFRQFLALALSPLRRIDDRHSEIYSRGTIHMHLLRFFLAVRSVTTLGCAPARRRTRASTVSQSPLCQLPIGAVCPSTHDANRAFDPPPCSPIAQSEVRAAFKSHRPASTAPAASS